MITYDGWWPLMTRWWQWPQFKFVLFTNTDTFILLANLTCTFGCTFVDIHVLFKLKYFWRQSTFLTTSESTLASKWLGFFVLFLKILQKAWKSMKKHKKAQKVKYGFSWCKLCLNYGGGKWSNDNAAKLLTVLNYLCLTLLHYWGFSWCTIQLCNRTEESAAAYMKQ